MLSVETITGIDRLEQLAREWDALERTIDVRVPFRSFQWNRLWWNHFGAPSGASQNLLSCFAVRDGDRLVAVAPMMVTRRPGRPLPLVRELQFFGADPNMTELRGLVCREDDQPRVIKAMCLHFERGPRRWDWVQWCGINPAGLAVLGDPAGMRWRNPTPDFYLPLPVSWDSFRAGLSRNIKESLRKCYNSLKRDGHEFVFRAVAEPDRISAAVARFYALHADRSNAQAAVRHGNVFATPRCRAFMDEYCVALAREGRLRVFQLEIAGTVVATRLGFICGDQLFLYYSGYMPEWGRYSVMTTVVAEALRWAIENGLRVVNLSTGRDVSKTRWGPQEIDYVNGLKSADDWLSRARLASYAFIYERTRPQTAAGRLMQKLRG